MQRGLWLLFLAAASVNVSAASMDEAASLFEAKRWADAASAYQAIVQDEPQNAVALVRLARARAANGQADEAFAALQAWFATGTGAYLGAMRFPEFAGLRDDPRFAAIVEPHKPCNTTEYRQFDFWVGDWDVETPAAPGRASHSRITRIHDGCTILEQYESPDGYVGSSLNFYDAPRKVWHQTWIDNQGGALYLEGRLEGKAMVLRSVGEAVNVQCITWTPLDGGGLRQHWESTTDGGKTWATVFDGNYRPREAG